MRIRNMDFIFSYIIALEMVVVTLFAVNTCLHKRYKPVRVYLLLTVLSMIAVTISLYLNQQIGFGIESSLFILSCLILLCPSFFLYKESCSVFLTVLSAAGVYTMLIFSISVHIGALLPGPFPGMILAVQSFLHAACIYWMIRFLKDKSLYLLNHISGKINCYFHWVTIIWLLLIVVLNLAFSYTKNEWLSAAALLILTGNLLFSYMFLYHLLKNDKDINYLKKAIYLDEMTGLCNRSRMFLDAAEIIKEKRPFYLFYIDLNDFKSVNDSHGHLAGDNYLCRVSGAAKKIIGDQGKLYRMSGDEFICIYTGTDVLRCLTQLNEYPWEEQFRDMEFLGFSLGYSKYPDDSEELDNLIYIADSRMYQQKRHDSGEGSKKICD